MGKKNKVIFDQYNDLDSSETKIFKKKNPIKKKNNIDTFDFEEDYEKARNRSRYENKKKKKKTRDDYYDDWN